MDLNSADFGPQASLGKTDAPLGHLMVDGKPKAMLAGPNGDNPLILGPAGTMHMSVLDFAKWVAWHAGEVTVDWTPEPVITHTGSNTMNLALAMFWPQRDFGCVIMTNIAGTAADEALRKLSENAPAVSFPCLTSRQKNRLQRLNLTDSQQLDAITYEPGQIVEFHRMTKGAVRGGVPE
jgi:hypothetical protein